MEIKNPSPTLRRNKTNDELLFISEYAARAILAETLSTGNGYFTSEFGPSTYGHLVRMVTKGAPDGYCTRNGHLFNPVKRCVICNTVGDK